MNCYMDIYGRFYAANAVGTASDCSVPFPSATALTVLTAATPTPYTQADLDAACIAYNNAHPS